MWIASSVPSVTAKNRSGSTGTAATDGAPPPLSEDHSRAAGNPSVAVRSAVLVSVNSACEPVAEHTERAWGEVVRLTRVFWQRDPSGKKDSLQDAPVAPVGVLMPSRTSTKVMPGAVSEAQKVAAEQPPPQGAA
jgi:hypothetical protein